MTLGLHAVRTLDKWGSFADEPHTLAVSSERFVLRAEVVTADHLSCSIRELRMEPHAPLQLTADQLSQWAARIAKQVRYLLEAIETVELDKATGRLLLRSVPPEKKSGATLYYELLLEAPGRLTIQRHRVGDQERCGTGEPMHLTRQLLEKLLDDLVATAP